MTLKKFAKDCDGAVTVEWVVVTALVVTLCLTVIGILGGGLGGLSTDVKTQLVSMDSSTVVSATSNQESGDDDDSSDDSTSDDDASDDGADHN